LKELRETLYWLRFIVRAKLLPDMRLQPLLNETDELCKIIGASITTASQNRTKDRDR
jgi:four helix bundle protein